MSVLLPSSYDGDEMHPNRRLLDATHRDNALMLPWTGAGAVD